MSKSITGLRVTLDNGEMVAVILNRPNMKPMLETMSGKPISELAAGDDVFLLTPARVARVEEIYDDDSKQTS